MKRITVGRSTDCNIVIIDDTDNVSRHHLVISFDLLGRMKVSDTSSNGTFINGTRMLKGTSIPVSRQDKIRLGRETDLDWNLVKDPYRPIRMIAVCCISLLMIAALMFFGWKYFKDKTNPEEGTKIEMISTGLEMDDSWNKDSTAKVAPTVTSIDVKGKNDKPAKSKSKSTFKETNRKNPVIKKVNTYNENAKEKADYSKEKRSGLDSIAVF